MRIKVAFTLIGGRGWMGGYNYLLNLFRALAEHGRDDIEIFLLVGTDLDQIDIEAFETAGRCTVIRDVAFNASRARLALALSLLLGRDPRAYALIHSLKIDLIFEAASFRGWRLGIPAIAWMPDFQHRFLPDFFSLAAWFKREVGFQVQIRSGRSIMVSSHDSRQACEAFYPVSGDRVRTVHFAVSPPPEISDIQAADVRSRYALPERFFLMPNQFWAHKNHRLVVEALKLLAARDIRRVVLSSGSHSDPRNVHHFEALRKSVDEAGLTRQFLMPGLIPVADLHALMSACDALINPSLFEGWSTTVEEARSAGVPLILSDLTVHREQAGEDAVFFDRHSSRELAHVLETHVSLDVAARAARRKIAAQNAEHRIRQFARDFIALAKDCLR